MSHEAAAPQVAEHIKSALAVADEAGEWPGWLCPYSEQTLDEASFVLHAEDGTTYLVTVTEQ